MKTVELPPRDLIKHMVSLDVYGEEPEEGMEDSVRERGIFQPIILAADGRTIVSGVRRRNAAIKAKRPKVTCIVREDLKSEADIHEAIVFSNMHQERSNETKAREYQVLKAVGEKRARAAMSKGGKGSQNSATLRTREDASSAVGMSHDTLEKASRVVEEIDKAAESGDRERARELREKLERSVNGAHKAVSPPKPKQTQELSPVKMVDECKRHVGAVVRGIDAIAKVNGGKGENHSSANAALDVLLMALSRMRKGEQ